MMKITKGQLRRVIRESLMPEIFGFGKKKEKKNSPQRTIDLKGFADLVADKAFEEDVPSLDMSDPSNLEWIATSDKEIQRIGKDYRRPPEEVKAFLDLDKEKRKELLR